MEEEEPDDLFGGAMAIASETTEAEREFENVLEQLRDMEGLKLISDVYTKLYDSYFSKKEENQAKLTEIDNLQHKVSRFDEVISQYQVEINDANKNMDKLRCEIEEARTLADAMHARELLSVESLDTLKKTCFRLEKELDARKRAGDDEAGPTSAAKEKEKFEKEKAKLQNELDAIKLRLTNALNYQEEMEAKNNAAEELIAKQEEQLEDADNNAVRQNRLVEHIKAESEELKADLDVKRNLIATQNEKITKMEKQLERRDRQIKELNFKLDHARQEMEAAVQRATMFRDNLENLRTEFENNKSKLISTTKQLKNSIDDGHKLRAELAKQIKHGIQQTKRYQLLENTKAGIESDRDRLRQQVSVMEREIQLSTKQSEADHREIENLNREKEVLNKTLQKIQTEAQDNLRTIQLQDQRRLQLEHELAMNARQITKQRLLIRQFEKEKDRMLEETIALNEKIDEINDEVRLRTVDLMDLKKAHREEQTASRKLTVALDTTRAERNMLHKNYTEALDEIQDLKQKLKMLAYQIEQMKEDITGKETGLKSCEAALSKCNKKVEQLRTEIQAGSTKLSEARAEIAALRQEEARLNRLLLVQLSLDRLTMLFDTVDINPRIRLAGEEGDAARAKVLKDLEGLMNERDVVGAQLVRRNDEISLLYEKGRILEITLQRGERQYEARVEDIRLLRLEILRLRKEKNLLSKGIENMTDLRLEVFNIERELGRERLRVRALEQALETPLNVHRWRKLQGTDPESVHLTHKLRLTQKKVLMQSEMLVLRDRELKETRNLYAAVKDMLALQPSPEIQQTLARTQRALANKTTKLKCLVAELSMRERQVHDLRLELERVSSDLLSFKQKYYGMKRALDADEARRLRIPTPPGPGNSPAHSCCLQTVSAPLSKTDH